MSETQLLEGYLLDQLHPSDKLVIDAKLVLDSELRAKTLWQQHTYALVKTYGRLQLKKEIEAVHVKLFSESRFERFREQVKKIFQ